MMDLDPLDASLTDLMLLAIQHFPASPLTGKVQPIPTSNFRGHGATATSLLGS